jgi:hypothetical protein
LTNNLTKLNPLPFLVLGRRVEHQQKITSPLLVLCVGGAQLTNKHYRVTRFETLREWSLFAFVRIVWWEEGWRTNKRLEGL